MIEKKFTRNIDSLQSVFDFTEEFARGKNLDREIEYAMNLVIEELFTNMVKYNKNNPNKILIALDKKKESLIITMTDYDVEPFDITRVKDHDPQQPLQERQIGGLGIPFIKKMVDKITYEYENRCSKITLVKHLRDNYVGN